MKLPKLRVSEIYNGLRKESEYIAWSREALMDLAIVMFLNEMDEKYADQISDIQKHLGIEAKKSD